MRRVTLVALFATLPASAFADDLLDRYRVANDTRAAAMADFYVARVPDLAGVMPSMTWDAEIEATVVCQLDKIRAARGDAGVEEYVTAMEQWVALPITSFGAMADGMPAVLTDGLAMSASMECGSLDLAMRRMTESGLLARLQEPAVLERLMALE